MRVPAARYLSTVAALALAFTFPAQARTLIAVLPATLSPDRDVTLAELAKAAMALKDGDQLIVYAGGASPSQIAVITSNSDAPNRAIAQRRLAQQFAPVRSYIASLPALVPGQIISNELPAVLAEIGRNVLPSLPDKKADVMVQGPLLHRDARDEQSDMFNYVPSDGMLYSDRSPFNVANSKLALTGATIHLCSPENQDHFVSNEHREKVIRFWSLFISEQGGRIGTVSTDLGVCARRFLAGEASGQRVYQPNRDAKPEMLPIVVPRPAAVPASLEVPGEYFLRDDAPVSRVAPATTRGTAWLGIKWRTPKCDLDLYARPDSSAKWLYFGQVRTEAGVYNKDYRDSTPENQLEYTVFSQEIDLTRAEAKVNVFNCDASTVPSGEVRLWFKGRIYSMPFAVEARTGNGGKMPMTSPYWSNISLLNLVGLTP